MIMNLSFNYIAPVTLFYLADKIRLLVINLPVELILNQVDNRSIIKFVWGLRKILPPVHTLQHGRMHRGTRHLFVFLSTVPEPSIALKTKRRPMNASLVLDPTLDIKVVAEDLSHRTILL